MPIPNIRQKMLAFYREPTIKLSQVIENSKKFASPAQHGFFRHMETLVPLQLNNRDSL